MIAGWSKFVNSILLILVMNRHTIDQRYRLFGLRPGRTDKLNTRNLNETKRPGRTDKPNTQELERNKAIWTNEQKNWCIAVCQMIKICWEDFEAPKWCVPIKANVLTFEWDVSTKIQDIQNFRITTNIFCL
ncbi:unnamed protein product [Rhizophagus irregularis]|uniref:Uncharacterized protein n=1 Tax=Rhizophagus irregularis TaxID=588596 RepID=A0A916EET9_9GLOM|nr:unnamed protein product [Rhizophagus irregularis]CAB5382566.1 unnamed protein product [Rhizophagus irregularis]